MNVEQLIQQFQQCEPTARVALVETAGIAEIAGLLHPADRDIVLLSNAHTGLTFNVK
jgi:hypothetical protein